MIPKHLAPIITHLAEYENPKVSRKTIQLEREIMKDGYRANKQSEAQFRLMIEQEKMLMREEQNNEQVNVCPTCFNIYNYLEEHYFEVKEDKQD
jgi:hypothetical protein